MAKKEIEHTEIEAPYELPEGWKWETLEKLCFIPITDGTHQTPTYSDSDSGIPFISSKDVTKEFIDWSNIKYITKELHSELYKRVAPQIDDILLAKNGTTGVAAIVDTDKIFDIYVTLALIRPNKEIILPRFLLQVINSPICKNQFDEHLTGIGVPNLHLRDIRTTMIPLPPTLAEQQRIVNRIESMFAKLDEAKEKAQNVVDGFETRKAAILHKAFTGELTAKWRKENGVSDDSWEEKLFDSCIAKMQNGLSKRSGNEGEETVVLRLANMGEDDFDVSDLRTIKLTSKEKNNYSLAKNDVVMIRVNGSKTNVGRQLLVKNNKGWSFCDHIIRIQFEVFCLPNYMVYFSKTKEYIDYVQDNMVSSAGQNTISRKGLSNLSLKVPTLPEQQEIVRILEIIIEKENKAKQAAEAVLEQIDLLKKSILARAFRGEL